MKSMYVWWDRNLSNQFQECLLNALNEIIRLGEDFSDHFNVRILGNFFFDEGTHKNADWYFDSSFDLRRNQTNASFVLDKCAKERWPSQDPHMTSLGLLMIFGMELQTTPLSLD